MSNIIITKKDEAHIKLTCEPSIEQELHSHFSFDAPGARFHPKFRSKVWDGKIHMYSLFTKELYFGLKPYVKHFAEVNNYSIEDNAPEVSDYVTKDDIVNFCKELKISSKEEQLEVRDYQYNAIFKAIKEGRKLLLSPTGSGKSLIIYACMRWHLKNSRKILIIVPTTSLVEQLYSDFQDYSFFNQWKASYNCYRIYGTVEKTTDMPVTISTWQSIHKLPKKFFDSYDVIFGDECHLFKAKSLTTIMNKCKSAPYRIGTTGTLDDSKIHRLILEGLFGTVLKTTTTKNLIENKQLADLKIYVILLKYSEEICKQNKQLSYQQEMDYLVQNVKRNTFIKNLTLKQKGNSLVLFQFVEKHGKALYDMICVKDRKVFLVYGDTDTKQRENIRKITEKEHNAIIIASYGTFSTGINIKNLHNIIFASPSKSKIRNLQSIGRGLRIGDNKVSCNLYDIGDDMTWRTRNNYTLLHMKERIKMYSDEKFDYKFIKVEV